ncbi:uncharacterized protein LOC133663019 [Entelurus aequoreus]|uniref:uncharacterized protein LOC133663019 n=1 Tax=Entelurus aequoreus TaxID=161455 RepID=UPI002B1DB70D|nr:uncharacterized protein LOC133663019 [Entelurus aequoreus]
MEAETLRQFPMERQDLMWGTNGKLVPISSVWPGDVAAPPRYRTRQRGLKPSRRASLRGQDESLPQAPPPPDRSRLQAAQPSSLDDVTPSTFDDTRSPGLSLSSRTQAPPPVTIAPPTAQTFFPCATTQPQGRGAQKVRGERPLLKSHRLWDSDDSEEDPGNGDLASLGLASQLHRQTPPSRRVPARVMSTCQLDSSTGDNFLAHHHGEGRIHMPSPAPALNMQRVTQGTAVPPRLPPPPSPAALNMWQTEEPGSSLAYRPTWRGGRMADNISCSAPEVIQILSLLETITHNQDQLIAKVL